MTTRRFLLALLTEVALVGALLLLLSPAVLALWPQVTVYAPPSASLPALTQAMAQQLGQPPPQFSAQVVAQAHLAPVPSAPVTLQPATLPITVPITDSHRIVGSPNPKVAFPINLNVASAQTLEALPGVGPVLAHRIVAYRTQHGGHFKTLDELDNVKGIGSKKIARFKPLLVLE